MQAPNILSAEFEKSPYPLYENIRENYPLFFHEVTNSYVVSCYEDVERAFKDPAFSSRHAEAQFEPVYGRTMVQMDGREHATNRNLVIQALGSYKLNEKYLSLIKENAKELLSKFSRRGEVELVEEFTSIYPLNVIRTILGLPKEDMPVLKKWCIDISNFLSNLSQNPDVTAAGLQSSKEFQAYLAPVIKQKKQNPDDDLVSSLCVAEIDGIKLTDAEITSLAMILFGAGGETTDKALALMFRNLIVHQEQLQKVIEDRSLVENAFTETLVRQL